MRRSIMPMIDPEEIRNPLGLPDPAVAETRRLRRTTRAPAVSIKAANAATRRVVTVPRGNSVAMVAEPTPMDERMDILLRLRVKRVPIVRGGRLLAWSTVPT